MTQRPDDPPWSAAPPDGAADPERLAALLDGRLGGAERDELLAHLAADAEDLALFADAAAVQRELEAEDEAAAEPGVLPLRRPARRAPRRDRRWLAAAAVLAGVALIPLAWRASQPGAVRTPSQAVALLENPAAGVPAGWEVPSGNTTRGGAGDLPLDGDRAARLGAYMVDLELAIRAADAEQTGLWSARAAALLDGVSAGGIAAYELRALESRAGEPAAELLPAFEDASRTAAGFVDADRFALGAWTEAARLAARSRDAAFFREARTRRTLDRAEELVGNDEEARRAIHAIRASVDPVSPRWPELEAALDDLMRAIA